MEWSLSLELMGVPWLSQMCNTVGKECPQNSQMILEGLINIQTKIAKFMVLGQP